MAQTSGTMDLVSVTKALAAKSERVKQTRQDADKEG
jgi:hypothetical protein